MSNLLAVDYIDGEDSMRETFERQLAEARIQKDLKSVLAECGYSVELEGGEVTVPQDSRVEIVARSWHTYEVPMGLGEHFRVLAAVGGLKQIEHGVPQAALCFATLYYSAERELITVDFTAEAL